MCDYKLARIGIVNNILGPVRTPYVSIQPLSEKPGALAGRVLYLVEKD